MTRISVLEIARELGLAIEERPFTPDELFAAREAFVSAAGTLVLPVVEVDGRAIGDGMPGRYHPRHPRGLYRAVARRHDEPFTPCSSRDA